MSEIAFPRSGIGPWQAMGLLILWLAIVLVAGPVLRAALLPHAMPAAPRDIVGLRVLTGLPFTWAMLAGTIFILKLRGRRLADLGWGRPASFWGWLAAASVTAFFVSSSFRGPACHGLCFIDPHVWLTDWSPFRLASSLAIGVTAGICEETMFRGFVMTQARDGRAPLFVQVILSGVLFGAAHLGMAGLSGHFDPAAAIGIVGSTTVFGVVFAIIYLLSRRSLIPVMIAHGIFAFTTEPWMMLWGLARTMH